MIKEHDFKLGLKNKKLNKNKGVKKWLKKCEKIISDVIKRKVDAGDYIIS